MSAVNRHRCRDTTVIHRPNSQKHTNTHTNTFYTLSHPITLPLRRPNI